MLLIIFRSASLILFRIKSLSHCVVILSLMRLFKTTRLGSLDYIIFQLITRNPRSFRSSWGFNAKKIRLSFSNYILALFNYFHWLELSCLLTFAIMAIKELLLKLCCIERIVHNLLQIVRESKESEKPLETEELSQNTKIM